jgi:DNA-binding NarL/FixJ family response regulator
MLLAGMGSDEHIKVLVVDDHQMFAQTLELHLENEDDISVVAVATTAEEARALANEHQPDVVLMDYELPDTDGARAAEQIKSDRPETKVIMLTGFAEDDILVAAIEAGCSGYVTKHNAVDEVVSAVRAAAAGEALISPSMLARLLPKLRRGYQGLGSDITPRELEVLRMLAEGLSNRAIADKMSISLHTVRNYVQSLLTKLQSHSKLEAVAAAVREGIIRYP